MHSADIFLSYLYGGRNPINGSLYDDVWILSLPAFHWTQVYAIGTSPRWGHDCHVAGQREMITVGGNTTNEKCDWEKKGVAVLDMTTVNWGSVFDADAGAYKVPRAVLGAIGGSEEGGATVTQPAGGFDSPGLAKVFNTTRRQPGVTPTPSSTPSSNDHAGPIAGGVVGGVVVIAIIAGLFWLRVRKRRKERQPHELSGDGKSQPLAEMGEQKKHYELQGASEAPVELPTPHGVSEANPMSTTYAAELPGTNVVPGGKTGIPHIRTPSTEELPVQSFRGEPRSKEIPSHTPPPEKPQQQEPPPSFSP